jgi:outer membrane lipopolysaccharide assembly protein LptE/RlpB
MLLFENKTFWLVLTVWLSVSACGYHFTGGGNVPGGIKTLSINVFENRTAETGVENDFTNDLIYEFTRTKKVVLTTTAKADAVFTGVITSLRTEAISHKGLHTSQERRVVAWVNLKITDKDGGLVWTANNMSENEAYIVMSDKQATEQNRRDAIVKLSKRLAEKIYNRLTDNF